MFICCSVDWKKIEKKSVWISNWDEFYKQWGYFIFHCVRSLSDPVTICIKHFDDSSCVEDYLQHFERHGCASKASLIHILPCIYYLFFRLLTSLLLKLHDHSCSTHRKMEGAPFFCMVAVMDQLTWPCKYQFLNLCQQLLHADPGYTYTTTTTPCVPDLKEDVYSFSRSFKVRRVIVTARL